jgi:phospho-N-acetylmuramoyl-pentapeptide-transferase
LIYHLLWFLRETVNKFGFYAYQDVSFRCLTAVLTSIAICFLAGPRIIGCLKAKKISDRPEADHARINEINKDKADTPTMGGVIIIMAMLLSTLLWAKLNNPFIQKAIFITIWFGVIGGVDDWLKLTRKEGSQSRDGLKPWEKLLFQFGGAVLIALFLFRDFANIEDGRRFWVPFYKYGLPLSNWAFIIMAIIYISATSNAVNLTDGMDGLATGCVGIISVVLVILCYVASETMASANNLTWAGYLLLPHIPQAGELSVFYSAMFGSLLGFLWFNCYRARIFMGDTGALPLGAAIGYGALVTKHEILLLIAGGVFMIELASVALQVGYFKYTGGRRLFRIAPIHHHFQDAGWPEPQVVVRFWILAAAFAAIALATLKLR